MCIILAAFPVRREVICEMLWWILAGWWTRCNKCLQKRKDLVLEKILKKDNIILDGVLCMLANCRVKLAHYIIFIHDSSLFTTLNVLQNAVGGMSCSPCSDVHSVSMVLVCGTLTFAWITDCSPSSLAPLDPLFLCSYQFTPLPPPPPCPPTRAGRPPPAAGRSPRRNPAPAGW